MRLNNSDYCAVNAKSPFCYQLEESCHGIEYPYFCEDAELFATLAAIIEIPIDILDLLLSATIIFISIAGKINGTFKWFVMNIAVFHLFYPIFGRVIGVQGVTTSIAGSLPLALNRFMITHQSRFYNTFFETGNRCFWTLLCYDIATFGTFYLLNMLVLLSNGKVIRFPASVYYLTTITMVTVTNTVGLILMLFVLYHIHSSVKAVKTVTKHYRYLMRLNNSDYCAVNAKSPFCYQLEESCHGIEYPYFCEDAELFATLAAIIEIPIDILDLLLSATIIFISIAGKINGTFKWFVMNIAVFHLFYPIFGRVIGVQGVTTSIAGSLPLALNRFMITHQSRFYNTFFETGNRCFWTLLCYDIATFGTFYLLNMLVLLSNGKVIRFPASVYYLTTITMVTVTNTVGLILMLFVLYHIHSSVKLSLELDQKQMLQERKRVAYVIVAQSIINFMLCAWRLKSFYNVFLMLSGRPIYSCYNPFLNFVNYFTYVVQELLVCLDSLIYIFFLPAYKGRVAQAYQEVFQKKKGDSRGQCFKHIGSTVPENVHAKFHTKK